MCVCCGRYDRKARPGTEVAQLDIPWVNFEETWSTSKCLKWFETKPQHNTTFFISLPHKMTSVMNDINKILFVYTIGWEIRNNRVQRPEIMQDESRWLHRCHYHSNSTLCENVTNYITSRAGEENHLPARPDALVDRLTSLEFPNCKSGFLEMWYIITPTSSSEKTFDRRPREGLRGHYRSETRQKKNTIP